MMIVTFLLCYPYLLSDIWPFDHGPDLPVPKPLESFDDVNIEKPSDVQYNSRFWWRITVYSWKLRI